MLFALENKQRAGVGSGSYICRDKRLHGVPRPINGLLCLAPRYSSSATLLLAEMCSLEFILTAPPTEPITDCPSQVQSVLMSWFVWNKWTATYVQLATSSCGTMTQNGTAMSAKCNFAPGRKKSMDVKKNTSTHTRTKLSNTMDHSSSCSSSSSSSSSSHNNPSEWSSTSASGGQQRDQGSIAESSLSLAATESRMVWRSKLLVFAVLALAAVACAVSAYMFGRQSEWHVFQQQVRERSDDDHIVQSYF
jgi:hypothetical protein